MFRPDNRRAIQHGMDAGRLLGNTPSLAVRGRRRNPSRAIQRPVRHAAALGSPFDASFVRGRLVKPDRCGPGRLPAVRLTDQPIDARLKPQRPPIELERLALVAPLAVERAAFTVVKGVGRWVGWRHGGDYGSLDSTVASTAGFAHQLDDHRSHRRDPREPVVAGQADVGNFRLPDLQGTSVAPPPNSTATTLPRALPLWNAVNSRGAFS
jgi:hypothetical protein